MTVSTTSNRKTYTGDGVSTVFAFPYKFIETADIVVYVAGVRQIIGYTVGTPSDNGANITFSVAPANLATIVILADPARTQATSLPTTGPFPAKTVETMADKLTLLVQRLYDLASRSLTLSDGDSTTASTTLPTPSAGKLLGWNASASQLANIDPASLATTIIYGTAQGDIFSGTGAQTVFSLSASPGALNNLDVSISGVTQRPGLDYTWASGTTLTFTSAPPAGTNNILVRYLQALAQGSSDSGSVAYIPAGTGAVTRNVQTKLRERLSVKDFGAVGDGVTDDTIAINTANAAAVALNKELFWPTGVYIASNIPAIANMRWVGEGVTQTIVKLKNGTNAGLVTSASTNIDDVYISHMQFDGNSSNNTTGDTLTIKGCRTRLIDIEVRAAAGNAIVTDWNVANGARVSGCEGYFANITIDQPQQNGWVHSGPSDSHFESVIIIDAGLKTNSTYIGLNLVAGSGNGRFFNVHCWNRDSTTNVPLAGVLVASSGNNFSGCHFEGGTTSLSVTGAANIFSACSAYAPRGSYTINMAGSSNAFQGAIGLTYATANPTYKGVLLLGPNNILDIVNSGSGCTLGAVDFGSDPGENIVRLVGNQATGTVYNGTPAFNSEVEILVSGAAGVVFTQNVGISWTAFTPSIASGSGALTTASTTGRYRKNGKTVHIEMVATITANGTGATNIVLGLPFQASAFPFILSGKDIGVSAKMLEGAILASGTTCSVTNYDGTYPAANGSQLVITGTYETA